MRIQRAHRRFEGSYRTLSDSAGMAPRNLRTANYSEDARRALGEAVASARRAAGFRYRTNFADAHEEVSVSSLKLVEQGKPLVGVVALEAIGHALGEHFPGRWTGDTPRTILEGADPPELDAAPIPQELDTEPAKLADNLDYAESSGSEDVGSDEWLLRFREYPETFEAGIAVRRKRRELEGLLRLIAEQEAAIAESALPNSSGERS